MKSTLRSILATAEAHIAIADLGFMPFASNVNLKSSRYRKTGSVALVGYGRERPFR
jgi:hypothetical protein